MIETLDLFESPFKIRHRISRAYRLRQDYYNCWPRQERRGSRFQSTPLCLITYTYTYSDDEVAAGLPNVGTMATTARSMYAAHKSPNNGRMCAVRTLSDDVSRHCSLNML